MIAVTVDTWRMEAPVAAVMSLCRPPDEMTTRTRGTIGERSPRTMRYALSYQFTSCRIESRGDRLVEAGSAVWPPIDELVSKGVIMAAKACRTLRS